MQSLPPPRRVAASRAALGPPPRAYQRLRQQLARLSWICQGTVVCRPLIRRFRGRNVRKGPYYLWTCKVQGQTLCQALSREQYRVLGQAIANHRKLQRILGRMHALTLQTVLRKVPGVRKRK